MSGSGFTPLWASPPGATMLELMTRKGLTIDSLEKTLALTEDRTRALLDGRAPINLDLARSISRVLGGSPEFWLARDCQYWDDLDRVEADKWVSTLPTFFMRQRELISKSRDRLSRIDECLQFFGLENVHAWSDKYQPTVASARYRRHSDMLQPGATSVWLRQGERVAEHLALAPYDPDRFAAAMSEVRSLTRRADPRVFIPALQRAYADVGVAVAVVQAPPGCSVSGAVIRTATNPLIVLSGRYLSDDHFWFTVMHESAHVLFHEQQQAVLDVFDQSTTPADSESEKEADRFASEVLVPQEHLTSLRAAPLTARSVVSAAHRAGVAPGIVVGALQHAGVLAYTRLNSLKRRYVWQGAVLAPK
jgi:HTH-type transcriptional regulator / antitoxin HigA